MVSSPAPCADRAPPESIPRAHLTDLPHLEQLARDLAASRAGQAAATQQLLTSLTRLHALVRSHSTFENEVVFPSLLREGTHVCLRHITVAREEHETLRDVLVEMNEIASALEPSSRMSHSSDLLTAGIRDLERDLLEHLHLENNVLYGRIAANE
ncbi:MAG: hypothetical protein HC923_12180 [Myxococcales bacterium]|nr:hypothetical protein [Myxococcales bacterium]